MKNPVSRLLVAALIFTAEYASAELHTQYMVTIDSGVPQVTKIMMIERGASWSLTWAFSVDGDGETTELVNPFPMRETVTRSLLIGLVTDLPFDPPGQKHVVMLMDNTAADLSRYIAWGTLFRHTSEEQLIANIELATSGQPFDVIQPALDAILAFSEGDAVDGILDELAQPHSAYLGMGGPFTVMAWSDGGSIGSGFSAIIEQTGSSVPEASAERSCSPGSGTCTYP